MPIGTPAPADAGTPPVRLLVCTSCRAPGGDADAPRPGARLLEALAALGRDGSLPDFLSVQPVECLSVCRRPCTVSLSSPGRWTYVYGDLDTGDEAAAVLAAFARQYQATADGLVPWRERPEPIRKGVVARIPPMP